MDDLLSIAVSNAVAATVLALVVLAVGAVYRRPALVHGLWLLVLLKLVTPPLVYIPVAWPTVELPAPQTAAVSEEPTIELSVEPRLAQAVLPLPEQAVPVADVPAGEEGILDFEVLPDVEKATSPASIVPPEAPLWPQLLRIVWAVGALAWFALVMERLHHFRRLLRFARRAPAALQERTRRLAGELGLSRCPRVRLLPGRIAPMLWAVGGPPCLFVPAELVGVLSEPQLDTLLVHELAHLRRRDHWVRLLEFVVMGLYWWHPVVWYARRELREAEEQCCDAWVVSTLPDTGRTYASALLDTLDFLSTAQAAVPPLASGLGQIADLKRRLTMIMQGNTPRSLTWPGCLAIIALGLTILPMLPSLQGEPLRDDDDREEIRDAKKDLERAKQDLEREQSRLEQKIKELIKAEQRMAAESAVRGRVQVERAQPRVARVVKDAVIRIEITLPADEKFDPQEYIKEIRKALPENLRGKVAVHALPGTQQWHIQLAPGTVTATPPVPPAPPAPPVSRTTPVPPQPAGPNSHPPAIILRSDASAPLSKSSEKRINDLERKLEKVLQELQEMRKQMKQPPGGSAYVPPPVSSGVSEATPEGAPPVSAPIPAAAPGTAPLPPATTTPVPPSETPPSPVAPSARRLPNPYGEYRCMA